MDCYTWSLAVIEKGRLQTLKWWLCSRFHVRFSDDNWGCYTNADEDGHLL